MNELEVDNRTRLSIDIFDYRMLPIQHGMFKPEISLTYDEVNILSKYLKMNIYEVNVGSFNVYLFSYLKINKDNNDNVTVDVTKR